VHGEDRHGSVLHRDQVAVGRFEREDEVVEAILLPVVERTDVSEARMDRPILRRSLEGSDELGIRAGQVVADLLLAGDLLV
jgi:hypothetical protein